MFGSIKNSLMKTILKFFNPVINLAGRLTRQKFIWNIPNALSLYRLLSFPVVLGLLVSGYEKPFVVLLVINLATDVLDGFIARRFNMQTEIGARLDSMADLGTYILAIGGVFKFKWMEFSPYQIYFFIFIGLFVLPFIITMVKFGRTSSLHLYSNKIAGYIQGFFFFTLFVIGFYPWFFWMMILSGYIAFSEGIIIHLISSKARSNARGLYWVLKDVSKSP